MDENVKNMMADPAMQPQIQGMQQALLTAQLFQNGKLTSKVITGDEVDAVKAVNQLVAAGGLPWGVPQRNGNFFIIYYFTKKD